MRDYDATVQNLRWAAKGLLFDAMPYRASVMQDAADAIEELVASVPKWISVEERLPDDSQDVLVFFVYGVAPITGIDVDSYNHRAKRWVNIDDAVTHWMPLPDPPKEVE
jgi:8-oxo-dGTP pyrophosphatase MutT (NUDIX family)